MTGKTLDEKAIFNIARGIDSPDVRAEYLHQACCADADLIERVKTLLRGYEDQASFLESPVLEFAATTDCSPISEGPGTQIGPYKLRERIGEGGMGVVFMAEQTEPIQRTVALKIIKPGMDTRQVIARFEAERQALAMMDHPHIAKVLDAGTTGEKGGRNLLPERPPGDFVQNVPDPFFAGRPYFVMELVKGVPITKFCDDKQMSLRERLQLFIQVCQAVQHAHQKGIIHRDLKPTNVMVAEYDGKPVPKVIDFGVAKATAQRLTERTMFTEFGQVIGTVEYMSPEQAKLNQLDIDTRSDIYSLSVLLYELLTGSPPFESKRLREAAFDEILRIIRDEDPPKPSTRLSTTDELPSIAASRSLEPKMLSGQVRGDLDWIVMKCLEKDRNRRYPTASGLAGEIERYLREEPVQACPPSAAYRFRKFARRNKGALATFATLAAILVAASIFSTWQAVRATRALEAESAARNDADVAKLQANAEAEKAKTEAAIAQAVNEFLNRDLLAQASQQFVPYDKYGVPVADLKLRTVLDRAAENLEGRFADQPLVEAALRMTIGTTYGYLNHDDLAAPHLRRAVELRKTHLGEQHPDTLKSMMYLARVNYDPEELAHTVEICRRIHGIDHPVTLRSMFQLAMVTRDKGEQTRDKRYIARAIELFRETVEAQRKALGEDANETTWTMHCLAHTLVMYAGKDGIPPADDQEIESLYRKAHAARHKYGEEATWHAFDITVRLGEFLNSRGRYEEAELLLQDAIKRLQSLQGVDPEMGARLDQELNSVYQNWGKPERADEWRRQQEDMKTKER